MTHMVEPAETQNSAGCIIPTHLLASTPDRALANTMRVYIVVSVDRSV